MDELEAFYERWVNIHNRVHADVFINGHTDKDFARASLKTLLVELRAIIDTLSADDMIKNEYDEGGLPIHLPMLVTAEGRGPCDDSDPDAHHYVCWCNTECSWQIALHHNTLSPGD